MPLRALRQRPEHAALLTDFDGTLSEIVVDPEQARPRPGVVETLSALAHRLGRVAVVSGRPVDFLAAHVTDPAVELIGQYGLEGRRSGDRWEHPDADRWRGRIDELAVRARTELPSVVTVEPKGMGMTLHYRGAPTAEPDVKSWAARNSGEFVLRPARRSVELHPPIEVDKGVAVLELADGHDPVAYLGDDVGDLPAFKALGILRGRGVTVARIVVSSAEVAEELLVEADDVVAGPEAMVALLRGLADA
ncbi:MAG: trehalose-phosphatase [Actinomycetota bacterium]